MNTRVFFLNSDVTLYGEEEINAISKLLIDAGVLNTLATDWDDWADNGDLKVTERAAGANMSVDVAPGWAIIETTRSTKTFKIFVENIATANLAVAANSSGSNRVDAVIARVSRSAEPNILANNILTLEVVTGSGTSPLSDNDISTEIGGDDFLRLADITVPNATADIEDGDIADTRLPLRTSKAAQTSPEILHFKVLANNPSNPEEGECWFNSTNHTFNYYNGTDVISLSGAAGLDESSVSNGAYIRAATISFDAASKEIRDSGNGFVTAGFLADQTITISGSGSNDGNYSIVSVAAGVIVVKESLVNEAAGSTIKGYCNTASRIVRADANGFVGVFTPYAADAQANDSYVISVRGVNSYVAGQIFRFKANTTNTGAATLNVNGLGAKTIKKNVSGDLSNNDILAGQIVTVIYDGTNFQLLNVRYQNPVSGSATATALNYDASTNTTVTHNAGFIPSLIKIKCFRASPGGNNLQSVSIAEIKINPLNGTVISQNVHGICSGQYGSVQIDAAAAMVMANSGAYLTASISSIGANSFVMTFGATGYGTLTPGGTTTFYYELYP